MRLPFGWQVTRTKATGQDLVTRFPPSGGQWWWPVLREGFAGAWQRGLFSTVEDALTHPTVFSCVTLIAGDFAKCRPMLVDEDEDGIVAEVKTNAPHASVLYTPNHYQDYLQFGMYWMLSKLSRGNTYVLKERDKRGVVDALYILDPTRVRPMVTPSGDVYYQLYQDQLSGIDAADIVVPAREIIHDRMYPIYHPLVGLSPIFACGHAAMQGLKIMSNTTRFAEHGSLIGGLIVAPGQISEETAKRLEDHWNRNYTGAENAGKVAVLGDNLRFEKPAVMSAIEGQIIEQLKWSDEKICSTYHVPAYMVGVGPPPNYNNINALNQQYYAQCLQLHFESAELCLTGGLELPGRREVEYDIDGLLRMDATQKMEVATKGIQGGVFMPNESRQKFNLKKVKGGDRVYLQKQNWPLDLLGEDATLPDATPEPDVPAVPPAPAPDAMKAFDPYVVMSEVAQLVAVESELSL